MSTDPAVSNPLAAYHDEIWRQVPERTRPAGRWPQAELCRELAGPEDRVLDLGCGDGLMLGELAAAGADAVGADVSAVALERAAAAHPEAVLVLLDGMTLPFGDEEFDGVWMSEVLSHALDVQGLLSETGRVLRAGGWIGVTVPRHSPFRDAFSAIAGFADDTDPHRTDIRRFSRRTLEDLLSGHGFASVRVRATAGTLLGSARRDVPPGGAA